MQKCFPPAKPAMDTGNAHAQINFNLVIFWHTIIFLLPLKLMGLFHYIYGVSNPLVCISVEFYPPVTSLKAPGITTHLCYLLFESPFFIPDIDKELIILIFLSLNTFFFCFIIWNYNYYQFRIKHEITPDSTESRTHRGARPYSVRGTSWCCN